MMGGKNNSRSWAKSSLDDTNDIGNTQTTKERPKKKVLESGGTGRKVINKRIILHVNSDKVIETRCGKVEDSRDFFGMEKIGSFIPVLHVSLGFDRRIQSTWLSGSPKGD